MSLTGLTLLLFDNEAAAEVYALASDRSQARVVHTDAKTLLEGAPELVGRVEILRDSIYVPATRSTFRVLAADATTAHGWRPSCALIDEIQLQRSRDLLEAAARSMSKRRQPVLIVAGHAGSDTESIGREEYEYARGVIAGTLQDATVLPVIFEAAETDDWQDEDVWHRVNPGLGVTLQLDGLRQEAQEAKNEPRKRNDFLRFHLNQWTSQSTSWLPIEWWNNCEESELSTDALRTFDATAGLDMAQAIDYASFVVSVRIPLPSDETATAAVTDETGATTTQSLDFAIAVFAYYWLPADTLKEREKGDGLPLSLYRDQGRLFECPGATISADQVYRDIVTTIAPQFPKLRTVGFDPAFAADTSLNASVRISRCLRFRKISIT